MNARQHLHDLFENELCLIGAASDAALGREVDSLLHALEHTPDLTLRDVAFTLAHAARGLPAMLAIVASSVPDLRDRLRIARVKLAGEAARIRDKAGMFYFRQRLRTEGGMVFLFPGETSQYPDMMRDLCLSFDICREAFDEADEVCQDAPDGFLPSEWLFGTGPAGRAESGAPLGISMAGAIQCTHAASIALARLFDALGIRPDAALGHSGGEFVALEYAGAFGALTPADRIRFLREGYQLTLGLSGRPDIPLHALLSVEDAPADWPAHVPERWRAQVALLMLNGPRQTIVAVPADAADPISEELRRRGARVGRLGLQRYYHMPAFAPALDPIRNYLRQWIRCPVRVPLYSCLRAGLHPESPAELLDVCVRQWCEPVRFGDTVEKLHADGFRVFVELGARGNLSTRVTDVLGSRPHVAVATDRIHRSGLTQLHHALAILAAHGVAFDATVLHRHRASRLLELHKASAAPRRARAEPVVVLDGTLPEIIDFSPSAPLAAASGPDAPAAGTPGTIRQDNFGADFPLLVEAETISEKPGERIELAKTFTTDDYPFLRDYALASHRVSLGNPRLGGLPILSAITCIEIMAEAARRLVPQKRVVQVDNLRGKRIVTLERGETRVLIQAQRVEWPDPGQTAVQVTMRTPVPGSSFSVPMAEATVFLANAAPERETARPVPLRNPRPANWTRPDIYPDRLFQGRLLQSVNHVFQWGENGLDYEIVVPSRADAVRATRFPLFSVWPLTMDGVSSGVSLWLSQEKFNGVLTLPFRARSIRFLATVLPEGARLRACLRITAQSPHSYVADVLVSDGRGRLVLTASGWEELICPVSPPVHRLVQRPSDTFLTQELPPDLLGEVSMPVRGSMFARIPHAIFEGQQELWLKAMAFALLNPAERDEWLAMRGVSTRRIEWLLGRACVKDTLRRHLLQQHQQNWAATDIPIWTDDSGKPHALGTWRDRTRETVDISIAHTSGLVAAAIAVNGRIGIDLERLGRDLTDDFSRSVFTPEEQELAAQSGEGPTTLLRFWCAKEALAKALGTGIRYSPSDLRARTVDMGTGRIDLELAGQWLDAFRPLRGRALPVNTALLEDHILATCVIPEAVLPLP
jgi:phosphopantetheinyl transferase/malonyl CoA-acyl carrier protein transacylase